jgi:uncharacterized protein (DUF58 family)
MMRPRRGGQDEFYGVKEYRPGDNPRRIYWRRSARAGATGTLVAKEMTQVSPPRLLIIVDTYAGPKTNAKARPNGNDQAAAAMVEKAIAMAASLAARALDDDLSVGLLAANGGSSGEYIAVSPSRGKRHRNDVLSLLARLPANHERNASGLLAHASRLMKSGTTAVLVTPATSGPECDPKVQGALVVLCAASPSADAWFRFEPGIRFGGGFSVQSSGFWERLRGLVSRWWEGSVKHGV